MPVPVNWPDSLLLSLADATAPASKNTSHNYGHRRLVAEHEPGYAGHDRASRTSGQ
jgi:hypothetical protein